MNTAPVVAVLFQLLTSSEPREPGVWSSLCYAMHGSCTSLVDHHQCGGVHYLGRNWDGKRESECVYKFRSV